jgi:hypothetical protein
VRRNNLLPIFVTLFLCAVAMLCAVSAVPAWAQSTSTGTVVGVVSDQSGAVVLGATVTLADTMANNPRTTTTNDAGRYAFINVDPGNYDMTFTKEGFATTKAPGQTIKVGVATTVDISLQVGGSTVQVEVSAVGNELQTMNATVGNTVTGVALDSLPSLDRDVSTFITLQPGISPDGSVAGTAVDQSYFSLDGGNNGGVHAHTAVHVIGEDWQLLC